MHLQKFYDKIEIEQESLRRTSTTENVDGISSFPSFFISHMLLTFLLLFALVPPNRLSAQLILDMLQVFNLLVDMKIEK